MKTQINLATKRIVQKRQLRKFFVSSLITFGVGVVVTVGILFMNFITNLQISSLSDKKSEYESEIARVSETRDQLLQIQDRLTSIRGVSTERRDVALISNEVLALFPPSIKVLSISYDEDGISVQIQSKSLSDMQNVLEIKLDEYLEKNKKTVSAVSIGRFQLNAESAQYESSVSIEFVQKKVVPKKREITNEKESD